jgi:hypothetical protein
MLRARDRVEAIVQIKRRTHLERAESVSVVRELNGVYVNTVTQKSMYLGFNSW